MKQILYIFLLFLVFVSQAFSTPFEEKEPRDERAILVPKGAQPMLKEEQPRSQLVVDRIKARHTRDLTIPFTRSWNTAGFYAMNGVEIKEEPSATPQDFEFGIALHSQRLRLGSLRNREYFLQETEAFPEGWYRPTNAIERMKQSEGYMTTTFVHLAAKRMRRIYEDYRDYNDRVKGILNVAITEKEQLTISAQRNMQALKISGESEKPAVRNNGNVLYRLLDEDNNKLEFYGDSVWSTIIDSAGRDFSYISGLGSALWVRKLGSDFTLDAKADLKISTFRDKVENESGRLRPRTLETRKYAGIKLTGIISPNPVFKLKPNVAALYDSEYKGYVMPGVELALEPGVLKTAVGIRRQVILPDLDELYWGTKFIKVNEELGPEVFWEGYGNLNINVISRFNLIAEGTYSRPNSRVTWDQLPGYVWTPINQETSQAIKGEAYIMFDLIGNFGTFMGGKYQRFDNQLFDPEITADGGFYLGRSPRGSITLGGSYWNFQPLENSKSPEDIYLVYLRVTKNIRRVVSIFIDGRYTIDREDIIYYKGMPQAGRIISVGANMVFGGLDW